MLDISEMSQAEIQDFLKASDYGHLGYIHEGTPFVMPMHYYLEDSDIYLFTTEGMKTHDIDKHPEICLQVEASPSISFSIQIVQLSSRFDLA